ncbi:Chaperone protein DnaJ-like protein [Drosera capensis]
MSCTTHNKPSPSSGEANRSASPPPPMTATIQHPLCLHHNTHSPPHHFPSTPPFLSSTISRRSSSSLSFRSLTIRCRYSTRFAGPDRSRLCPRGSVRGTRRRGLGFVVRAAKGDHYETLNLRRDASLDEIKSSYRKLARKYHPDMNKAPGAEEKFKEISAAYEVLSAPEKRSVYDRFGEAGLRGEYDGSNFQQREVDPFQVFEAIFGDADGFFGVAGHGGRKFNMRSRGSDDLDIRHDVSLKFEDSVFGGQQEIEISCLDTCDACDGSGAKSRSSVKKCDDCGGRGGVRKNQTTPFGVISQMSTCLKCDGDGKIITDYCKRCGGSGRTHTKRCISFIIPPGVDDGTMLRIQGGGNYDKKRCFVGDLYIVLHVEGTYEIWKEGLNLYSKVTVDFTEAILGTVAKVETVEGSKYVQIPPGTQPGDTIKLRNMGIPNNSKHSERGDHVVIVNVQVPKHISKTERALIEKLASIRVSSREHTIQTDDDTNLNWTREKRKHFSMKEETSSSVWDSVKNYLRRRPPSERFTSLTLQPSLPLSKFCRHLPSIPLWSVAIVVACIFAAVTAKVVPSMLRRRKDLNRPRPIEQDKR